jgi:hypothetical protein
MSGTTIDADVQRKTPATHQTAVTQFVDVGGLCGWRTAASVPLGRRRW